MRSGNTKVSFSAIKKIPITPFAFSFIFYLFWSIISSFRCFSDFRENA